LGRKKKEKEREKKKHQRMNQNQISRLNIKPTKKGIYGVPKATWKEFAGKSLQKERLE